MTATLTQIALEIAFSCTLTLAMVGALALASWTGRRSKA